MLYALARKTQPHPPPVKHANLLAVPLCAVAMHAAPALANWHPVGPPSATEILKPRQLVLTPLHDYVVVMRREAAGPNAGRPTLQITVRAPNGRAARFAAEAQQPGYSAIAVTRANEPRDTASATAVD